MTKVLHHRRYWNVGCCPSVKGWFRLTNGGVSAEIAKVNLRTFEVVRL